MKSLVIAAGVAALFVLGCGEKQTGSSSGAGAEGPAVAKVAGAPQTKCPVMGGKINKSVYADHNGKRIYFCCKGCDTTFSKTPEKYMQAMAAQGVVLEDTPSGAPK